MANEKTIAKKQAQVDELAKVLKDAKVVLLTDYRGITVTDVTKLRADLRNANAEYKVIKNKIIKYYQYQKKRYQDHNTHIYRKCPKCKQKIRLPLKKGKHTVKCPNCQHHFIVKCPRNEKIKIEIVK